MPDTTRLSLPQPSGTDLISGGDDAITEGFATLDAAAMYATGVIASRPSAASLAGRFYYATDDGSLSFSTGSAWIVLDSGPGVPIGGSLDYAGDGDPSDTRFLLEDGRAISRATYATLNSLMSAAGYPYGNGNGSTTFNIPDSRGRGSVAPDNMGTAQGAAGRLASNNTLGATGGAETKTLVTGNLPAHAHDQGTLDNAAASDHSHGVGTYDVGDESAHTHGAGSYGVAGSGALATGAESSTHTHSGNTNATASGTAMALNNFAGGGLQVGTSSGVFSGTSTFSHQHAFGTGGQSVNHTHSTPSHGHTFSGTSAAGATHSHGLSGSSASGGAHDHAITGNTGSVGSGTAYNQMHPYVVKNKIIRVL